MRSKSEPYTGVVHIHAETAAEDTAVAAAAVVAASKAAAAAKVVVDDGSPGMAVYANCREGIAAVVGNHISR